MLWNILCSMSITHIPSSDESNKRQPRLTTTNRWHGTVLAKLALVPQRLINAYTRDAAASTSEGKQSSH